MELLSSLAAWLVNADSAYTVYLKFPVELLAAEVLFTFWAKRRARWPLRLCATVGVLFLVSLLWPAGWSGQVEMMKYFLLFGLSVLGVFEVVEGSLWEALYRGMAAYATQHLANSISTLAMYYLPYLLSGYGAAPAGWWSVGVQALCYLASYVAVYLLVYVFFVRKIRREGFYGVHDRSFSAFLGIMLVLVIVLNYYRSFFVPLEGNAVAHVLLSLYTIIGCIFSLFIQAGFHQRSQLSQQLEITRQLVRQQEKQFRLSEETVNTINLKCHDLRHQVAALRRSIRDPASQQALEEIESATQIYDSAVKTGNPALDVILTEKSLLCENSGIQLTCMVDGSALSAVSDADLYAIFGNLLDNAIEGVMGLDDPEQRAIGLTVARAGRFLVIHTENYFNHPVELTDGLPVTTKRDRRYHGFGMRSLRLLAEKYGGSLSIEPDGDIFNVNILLPADH